MEKSSQAAGKGGDETGDGSIKAIKLIFPLSDIEKSLRLIHQKTGASNLDLGMDLVWHKDLNKDEHARVCQIVTILRFSLQGDIDPDSYRIHDHYKSIIIGKSPNVSGASTGLNL